MDGIIVPVVLMAILLLVIVSTVTGMVATPENLVKNSVATSSGLGPIVLLMLPD